MSFPEKLAKLMSDNCESNYALAKAIHVETTTVSNWLSGKNTPIIRHIKAVSDHYGVSVEELKE